MTVTDTSPGELHPGKVKRQDGFEAGIESVTVRLMVLLKVDESDRSYTMAVDLGEAEKLLDITNHEVDIRCNGKKLRLKRKSCKFVIYAFFVIAKHCSCCNCEAV